MADKTYYSSDRGNRIVCSCCSIEFRVDNLGSDVENAHRILPVVWRRNTSSNGEATIPLHSALYGYAQRSHDVRIDLWSYVAVHSVTESMIDQRLDLPLIRHLVNEVRFNEDLIRQIIRRQLETKGDDFSTFTALVETVLEELTNVD